MTFTLIENITCTVASLLFQNSVLQTSLGFFASISILHYNFRLSRYTEYVRQIRHNFGDRENCTKTEYSRNEGKITYSSAMSESAGVAITTVVSFLVIVDIVGNSFVCAIIKKNRDMRIPMNYLLVNLAVGDIVFAMFIAPKVILNVNLIHQEGMTGTYLCKFLTGGTVAWVGSASSIVSLVAIAIERYYAVMYPHGNKGKLTKRKLKVIIPGSWIFSLIMCTPTFLVANVNNNFCAYMWPEEWMGEAFTVTWSTMVFLSLVLMVGLYSKAVYTLWFKRNDDDQHTSQQRGIIRVRKRVTLMVVAVSFIFGCTCGTCSVLYVTSYSMGPVLVAISDIMVLFNSAVNPFVYALLNQQFKEKIKKMICCSGSSSVHPTSDAQGMEFANITTHASQIL
ncbi:hypothetical protein ACROYT_G038922 [Oculina patagonica]